MHSDVFHPSSTLRLALAASISCGMAVVIQIAYVIAAWIEDTSDGVEQQERKTK
jgi:hypothetical protein